MNLIGNNPPEYILDLDASQIDEISKQFNMYFFIIFGILIAMFAIANIIYYVRERRKKIELEDSSVDDVKVDESEDKVAHVEDITEKIEPHSDSELMEENE